MRHTLRSLLLLQGPHDGCWGSLPTDLLHGVLAAALSTGGATKSNSTSPPSLAHVTGTLHAMSGCCRHWRSAVVTADVPLRFTVGHCALRPSHDGPSSHRALSSWLASRPLTALHFATSPYPGCSPGEVQQLACELLASPQLQRASGKPRQPHRSTSCAAGSCWCPLATLGHPCDPAHFLPCSRHPGGAGGVGLCVLAPAVRAASPLPAPPRPHPRRVPERPGCAAARHAEQVPSQRTFTSWCAKAAGGGCTVIPCSRCARRPGAPTTAAAAGDPPCGGRGAASAAAPAPHPAHALPGLLRKHSAVRPGCVFARLLRPRPPQRCAPWVAALPVPLAAHLACLTSLLPLCLRAACPCRSTCAWTH